MRHLPHLTYLEAFEAAARHLSFTKAAQELNCTQAAISQRVRALETFFSRPLFHRHSNGLHLTDLGTAYLPRIAEALDLAELATQGLMGARAQTSVTVSAPLTFVALYLARHVEDFCAAHPQIELRLNSTIWTDPNVELADLNILALDPATQAPGAISLGRERLVILCDPRTASRATGLSRADWINDSRLVYVQGKMQLMDRWAASESIVLSPRLAALKVDNAITALEIAAGSGGVTAAMSTYAEPYLSSGRLVAPFGPGETVPVELHVVPNEHRRPSRSASLFAAWVQKAMALSKGSGAGE